MTKSIKKIKIRQANVLETLIAWAKSNKRSIPYSVFGYEQVEHPLLTAYFEELIEKGCFDSWKTNPFKNASTAEIVFRELNINKLQEVKDALRIIEFPEGDTVLYKNKCLYFEIVGDVPISVDFTKSPVEEKLVSCFWSLRQVTKEEQEIPKSEIQRVYRMKYKSPINASRLSFIISNIRKKYAHKTEIKERFHFRVTRESCFLTLY